MSPTTLSSPSFGSSTPPGSSSRRVNASVLRSKRVEAVSKRGVYFQECDVGERGEGRDGAARHGPAGAVARVPRTVAEAAVRGGPGGVAERGEGDGRAETGEAVRRAAAAPAVFEAGGRGLRGRAGVGGVALRAEA